MLFKSHEDISLLTEKNNLEFQKIILYFNQKKLALHKDKTKFMVLFKQRETPSPNIVFNYNQSITGPQDPNLIFPMSCINDSQEPYIKFLGLLVDPNLTFNPLTHGIGQNCPSKV